MLARFIVLLFFVSTFAAAKSANKQITEQLWKQLQVDFHSYIMQHSIIPTQYLLRLPTQEKQVMDFLRLLQEDYEEQIFAELAEFDANIHQNNSFLRSSLREKTNKQLQELTKLFSSNAHEPFHIANFTFPLHNKTRFFLDPEYGVHTLVTNQDDDSLIGFRLFTAQEEQNHLFYSLQNEVGRSMWMDFLHMQSTPDIIFTPMYYVFGGKQRFYAIGRKSLAVEHVGMSNALRSSGLERIIRVNDYKILAIYNVPANNSKFLDLFSLATLSTIKQSSIRGDVLAVSPQGDELALFHDNKIIIQNYDEQLHSFSSFIKPLITRFSDDGKLLVYVTETLQLQQINLATGEQHATDLHDSMDDQHAVLQFLDDNLHIAYSKNLASINAEGEINFRRALPSTVLAIHKIDEHHGVLIYPKEVEVYALTNGKKLFSIHLDANVSVVDHALEGRFISLLLENDIHNTADFGIIFMQLPLQKLIDAHYRGSLSQEVGTHLSVSSP